mmetsp:Transcript_7164/g.17873  ORF Transcript_7164/g.17873 Transcript_7164/m.17873 type:complete len:201 (-) Transcript_7164:120-722(-)
MMPYTAQRTKSAMLACRNCSACCSCAFCSAVRPSSSAPALLARSQVVTGVPNEPDEPSVSVAPASTEGAADDVPSTGAVCAEASMSSPTEAPESSVCVIDGTVGSGGAVGTATAGIVGSGGAVTAAIVGSGGAVTVGKVTVGSSTGSPSARRRPRREGREAASDENAARAEPSRAPRARSVRPWSTASQAVPMTTVTVST